MKPPENTQSSLTPEQVAARRQRQDAIAATKARKRETRRQFLVGAYVLNQAREEGTVDTLYRNVRASLKQDRDRALFETPENSDDPAADEGKKAYQYPLDLLE